MNILLTNDDGLESPGIQLLAAALREVGHRVTVIAPDRDRSGVSHSISFLDRPLVLKGRGPDTWSCSGVPVDCVVTAMLAEIFGRPDLILSGINRGANLGTDLLYSGTAAAARQGSFFGVPSVALSLVECPEGLFYWDKAVQFSLLHLEEWAAQWKSDTFVNVNLPNNPQGPGGTAPAFPSRRQYHDGVTILDAPNGDRYCFFSAGEVTVSSQEGSDREVVSRNLAAVSLIWVHPVSAGLPESGVPYPGPGYGG
jgi:5'-nucleotidase